MEIGWTFGTDEEVIAEMNEYFDDLDYDDYKIPSSLKRVDAITQVSFRNISSNYPRTSICTETSSYLTNFVE